MAQNQNLSRQELEKRLAMATKLNFRDDVIHWTQLLEELNQKEQA